MSQENSNRSITLIASTDLKEKTRLFVKVDENGKAAVAGAGDVVAGVLEYGVGEGEPCRIITGETFKVVAGDSVTAGDLVAPEEGGAAVPVSDTAGTYNVAGIALESAADGQVFEVLAHPTVVVVAE